MTTVLATFIIDMLNIPYRIFNNMGQEICDGAVFFIYSQVKVFANDPRDDSLQIRGFLVRIAVGTINTILHPYFGVVISQLTNI